MQPTFQTDRLVLRPRTMDDLEACLAMDRDPWVTRFIPGPWKDPEAHRAFVVARIARVYPDGLGYWTILERPEPSRFLGWVLLLPLDGRRGEIEIGWRVRRACWGRGIASEAARPILAHALATIKSGAVVADIDPRNVASLRVAAKIGLPVTGERMVDDVRAVHCRIEVGG